MVPQIRRAGRREGPQYNLSHMYHEGKGVPQDYAEAIRWCRKAAEHGDAKARGFTYYRGEGVAQDYAEAVHWYRKSAEQGYEDAEYDLGYMYYYGYGVPQDRVEANRLFHEAAAQGDESAQRVIGLKKVYVPTINKVTLFLKSSASLLFLIIFVRNGQSHRTREQRTTGLTALLLMSSVVLDLYWYFYIGHLRPSPTITAFYAVRQLLGGVLIAMLR